MAPEQSAPNDPVKSYLSLFVADYQARDQAHRDHFKQLERHLEERFQGLARHPEERFQRLEQRCRELAGKVDTLEAESTQARVEIAALHGQLRQLQARVEAPQAPAPEAAAVPNLAGATINAPCIIIVGDNNRVPPLPEGKEE
jgi:hypothetical protein